MEFTAKLDYILVNNTETNCCYGDATPFPTHTQFNT